MMKTMLEFQTQSAASDAKGPVAKNDNSEIHREEEEVEIMEGSRGRPHLEPFQREERGGRYVERQSYGGGEPRGAGWEHRGGFQGRREAVFEDRRGDFEEGLGQGRAREDRDTWGGPGTWERGNYVLDRSSMDRSSRPSTLGRFDAYTGGGSRRKLGEGTDGVHLNFKVDFGAKRRRSKGN
ncbi:hypothetical protein MA16_Dca015866 [Dendrobium catenatum]|uniref:Uncharacterized protein n=1 Tax=Dendrobium catenatum TaxID=906689 RepID=A0A2I0X0N5_9ASPA|nr:hypothetical protein MA16_Dca015866 [Dendrobium catenatum]